MSRAEVMRELLETEPTRVFSLEEIRDHLAAAQETEPASISERRIRYYAQVIGAISCWGVGYKLESGERV